MYSVAIAILALAQLIDFSHGGVLIWGSESIQLPSLKQFNNEDFDLLKSYMRRPKVVVFRGDPMEISSELQDLLKNKYTAYVPSSNLNLEGIIELKGDPASNFKQIEDTLNNCSREYDNILALIVSNQEAAPRAKREAAFASSSDDFTTEFPTESITTIENYEPATGPVLYKASTKSATPEVAMFYSSRTPVLKINATSYNLGKATVETVDDRDKYRQLSVAIPMEFGDKVTLRFRFTWNGGYWSLHTIILLDMSSRPFTLLGKEGILAPRNFSYHCSGTALFRDDENDIELLVFDIQAQPDAAMVRFDDAYDCVDFTTVPIWSGIFVVSLLLVGLAIGLGALNSIKTMDKFDNSKTKQLSITTSE